MKQSFFPRQPPDCEIQVRKGEAGLWRCFLAHLRLYSILRQGGERIRKTDKTLFAME
jgi:hypothetical protein